MMQQFFDWLYRFPSVDSWKKINQLKNQYLPTDEKDSITYLHITGTNGKGSVARYLHQTIVDQTNFKVGLFTSPHILTINERIMINQQIINDNDLLRIQQLIAHDVETYQLGFFAILTLIALIYFHEQNVNYAIIEVGIGGLYDATNIIKSDYVILTSIAHDHNEILGKTLKLITQQKLGIIKTTTKAVFVSGKLYPNLKYFIQQNIKAPLYFSNYQNSNDYFALNQSLAKLVINHLFPKMLEVSVDSSFLATKHWLRFQKVTTKHHNIYFDVAHNLAAIKALIKLIKLRNIKIDCIYFSALKTKQPKILIALLKRITPQLIVCQNQHYQSIAGKQFLSEQIYLNSEAKTILITGSCYFAAEVYSQLQQRNQQKGVK